MKGLGERLPPKVLDHCLHLAQDLLPLLTCYSLGHVNEITNVNEGPWRKATPKGSGSLPTPHLGFAATVIPWDTVLCNVKYKWNTDSCGFVSTCNNDFEANSTSLMSLWANIKFFPEPTGELYGWLLATLVELCCISEKYKIMFVWTALNVNLLWKHLCKDNCSITWQNNNVVIYVLDTIIV